LTYPEILDIGEDPTYFIGKTKFKNDPDLLSGQLWDKEANKLL